MYRLLFLLITCPGLYSQDLGKILWGDEQLSSPLNYDYISSKFDNTNTSEIAGDFYINSFPKGLGFEILRDQKTFKNRNNDELFVEFPPFRLTIFIRGNDVFISNKNIQETNHDFWDLSFSDGAAWFENGLTFVAAPFSLIQKNANCTHNGIFIFSINKKNEISKTIFQISSETCAYFQFNYVAIFNSFFELHNKQEPTTTKSSKVSSFKNLYEKYPNIIKGSFADSKTFNDDEVTAYGFFDGENHFIGQCKTRSGNYPFCKNILLPAYSLTKTVSGSLGIASFEKKYGTITDTLIQNVVPECSNRRWKNVTIENLSDMSSGNYRSSLHYGDEDSLSSVDFIFNKLSHNDKVEFACNAYPKKKKPGSQFVYHTSDTYLLGTALNNLLKDKEENDFFEDLLIPIFNEKDFSQKIKYIRRTSDKRAQPYNGWGMFLNRDDLVKLNRLFNSTDRNNFFSKEFLDEGLQLTSNTGLLALSEADIFYNNGFWAARFSKEIFGCKEDLMIPFMSGFGGITVVFLPNSMMYYYFSDNYTFSWYSAVYAAHNIKSLC